MKLVFHWVLGLLLMAPAGMAHASAALLLEEPFGTFGYLNPTGHAAIYLSDVCAKTPTQLRRCHAGENGVVVSRYHRVGGYDWLAMPLVPYLYAVDALSEVPETVTGKEEARLRNIYRREHLLAFAPDAPGGGTPDGEWTQLIGASYDRRIFVYQVDTSAEQDDAVIAALNADPNKSHFNLFFHNCADLSRTILNLYYPQSARRNYTADVGLTTPKQLARSMKQYARRHEQVNFRTYVLPQVSGSLPRSRHVDGVIESFLKTKYVLPVAIFQPVIAVGLTVDYLVRGRFNPAHDATALLPGNGVEALYNTGNEPGEKPVQGSELLFPSAGSGPDESTLLLVGLGPGAGTR